MAKTAKRLAGPAQVSNAAATKYTVPASTTTIIRHVRVSNTSAGAATFTMSIGADAAATRVYDGFPIAASTVVDWYGYIVVAATEIVQALSNINNQLTLTIFGDELTPG